ncbi:unnamed protein product [Prunus armeniaca]|uniref:Uncharacterized protein n=1 Tax=Prunus armeniaca TaxID=36596 RepID=A0A6J5WEB7_PRUAR|nr:unnamed protein product [Prunus armeniaca]CAB4298693.1 unnamed protein product [Prunus armeniaca]
MESFTFGRFLYEKPTFDIGDMAQNSHSYFRPNWHAASSSLYCYQLEAFVDMLGSYSSECLTNRKSQLDLLAEVVERGWGGEGETTRENLKYQRIKLAD